MKTIDEIIDIMHSPESSDSAVLWAGSKFDALSKEEVQSLYQRGKISLEELERHPAFEQSTENMQIIYNPLAGSCIGIGSTATALHLDYHYPKILPIKPDLFFSSMYLASNMRAFFSSSLARFCSFSVRSSKSNIADNILWILS